MPEFDRDLAAARETLCRLLAACYYEPGPEFAEENVFATLAGAAARVEPDLAACARRMEDAFTATDARELLVDYTRLFLGPVNTLAQPYASVWLDQGAGSSHAVGNEVLKLYARGGFDLDASFRDLPDHVAAELEFLYQLLFRETAARAKEDAPALAAVMRVRAKFLQGHLARWIEPFAQAVRVGAQTAFYRNLAELTERFVVLEARRT